jgi:hypothetical protein
MRFDEPLAIHTYTYLGLQQYFEREFEAGASYACLPVMICKAQPGVENEITDYLGTNGGQANPIILPRKILELLGQNRGYLTSLTKI